MKYILLAYTGTADWEDVDTSDPEFIAMCEFYERLTTELTESGELITTEGLAPPALTRTVRKTERGVMVSDGPYAESKEALASFSILDCDSHERVMDLAARIVDAVGDTVEVRPIPDDPVG